jgi:hypothetical protein
MHGAVFPTAHTPLWRVQGQRQLHVHVSLSLPGGRGLLLTSGL